MIASLSAKNKKIGSLGNVNPSETSLYSYLFLKKLKHYM